MLHRNLPSKYLGIALVLSLFCGTTVHADHTFSPGSGGSSSSGPLISALYDNVAGSGKTYTPPGNATKVYICVGSAGGGGGGATSGGAAALSGGGGGSGGAYCGWLTGAALTAGLTYSVGAGGTAGTCSATPSNGTNGGNSSISIGGSNLGNANFGQAGGTASTSVEGTAGTAGAIPTTKTSVITTTGIYISTLTAGVAGYAGTGDTYNAQGHGAGGTGGYGYGVTAGGACDATIVATNGENGYFFALAYQ
jgi:hypothetical protein